MRANGAAEFQFSLHNGPRRQAKAETDPERLPRVTRVLALALSFQDMIATGAAKNHEDLAKRTGVTAERLSQVMKLVWLAPAIQQEILYLPGCGGKHPLTECVVRAIAAKWSWAEQMDLWNNLKHKLQMDTQRVDTFLPPNRIDSQSTKEDQ
jgi:hypothetical protein